MQPSQIEFFSGLAHALAQHFGPNCEVVVHDLESGDTDHTIVAIENGHVTGRTTGGGPSQVVLETLHAEKDGGQPIENRAPYLTRTADGKLLKSSTIFVRDEAGHPTGVLAINFDITALSAVDATIASLISTGQSFVSEPQPITRNVSGLLEDLFKESELFIGKPASLMTKDERVRAIGFLDRRGAFLISKSSEKACDFFNISKYSFYTYLNEAKEDSSQEQAQ